MILHFSHIGLTDGLTFMVPFGGWVPAIRLWLPLRPPLPDRGRTFARAEQARTRAGLRIVASPARRGGVAAALRRGGAALLPGPRPPRAPAARKAPQRALATPSTTGSVSPPGTG